MMSHLKKLYGYYVPSFFLMHLNTDEDLSNLNLISYETKQTLHHEYVHFLQDITTVYGLARIIHTVDLLKVMTRTIRESNVNEFEIPVSIDSDVKVSLNSDLFSLYEGDGEIVGELDQIISCKWDKNNLIDGYKEEPVITIEYKDKQGNIGSFQFGSICILESMASLIEEMLFKTTPKPNFPYNIVNMIIQNYYPTLNSDFKNVIALCDVTLSTFNPARTFIEFLLTMKKDNFIPNSVQDIYDFAADVEANFNSDSVTLDKLFDKVSQKAEKNLTDYFTTPEVKSLNEWAHRVMNVGRNLRSINWVYKILTEDKVTSLELCKQMMDLTGFPLFSNNNNIRYCSDFSEEYKDSVTLLESIAEMFSILKGYKSGCGMKEFCINHPTIQLTDDRCDNAPWLKVNDKGLCPFARLWKMWGLQNYHPRLL